MAEVSDCGWQGKCLSQGETMEYLLDSDVMQSEKVEFCVGLDGCVLENIAVHKFILASRSAVFEAMFYGSLREKGSVRITDLEPDSFKAFTRYLYTDKTDGITKENVMGVLGCAKKYWVPSLLTFCRGFVSANVKPENAVASLLLARHYDELELANLTMRTIDQHVVAAFAAESFLEIPQTLLCELVLRDTLQINDMDLFHIIIRWAHSECERKGIVHSDTNKRQVLGDVVYGIRFLSMPVEDFANGPAQCGILTAEEVRDLLLFRFVNKKPANKFSVAQRRHCLEYIVSRFSRMTSISWDYNGSPDSIRFSVDRPVMLLGCELYGSEAIPAEYTVEIQLQSVVDKVVYLEQKCKFTSDGNKPSYQIIFTKHVALDAGSMVELSAKINGPASLRGEGGTSIVTATVSDSSTAWTRDGPCTFTFVRSAEYGNGTSVESGQIPSILFSLR